MPPKRLQLNLGCGSLKLKGFVNIDVEPSVKPDFCFNFVKEPFPYEDNTVDRVVLFHTIEHISKKYHRPFLAEVHRVLKPTGRLIVSYPEFLACVERWRTNYRGLKEFWEATLYGRQLFPSDFHVCIMHTPDFMYTLKECGFESVKCAPEEVEKHNTVVTCVKGKAFVNYETLCLDDMVAIRLNRAAPIAAK